MSDWSDSTSPFTGWTRERWTASPDDLLLAVRACASPGHARTAPPSNRIPVVRADSEYTIGLVAEHCQTRQDQDAAIAGIKAHERKMAVDKLVSWGSTQLVVNPMGQVMPCPAASVIPNLELVNVLDQALDLIWYSSKAFNEFRGTACSLSPQHDLIAALVEGS